jgi:Rrf2 family protein
MVASRAAARLAFSAKAAYALVALLELAAVQASGELLRVTDLAGRQGIPERYLEQVLAPLRQAGILQSVRGPGGGYRLVRAPGQLPLAEVLQVLEGTPAPATAAAGTSPEFAVVAALERELLEQRQARLQRSTLQELLEQRQAHQAQAAMFFI